MEKIKIAQIGVTHEHASGKLISLKKMPEVYELVGYVNDLEFNTTPRDAEAIYQKIGM